jgi:hypothetical protein
MMLSRHHAWEDWLGGGLGVAVGVTPWLAGEAFDEDIALNAAQVGLLILGLATFGLVQPSRWGDIGQLACGMWLMASPFVLPYADTGQLANWHIALGLVVASIASLELWQDSLHTDEGSPRRHTKLVGNDSWMRGR